MLLNPLSPAHAHINFILLSSPPHVPRMHWAAHNALKEPRCPVFVSPHIERTSRMPEAYLERIHARAQLTYQMSSNAQMDGPQETFNLKAEPDRCWGYR